MYELYSTVASRKLKALANRKVRAPSGRVYQSEEIVGAFPGGSCFRTGEMDDLQPRLSDCIDL